ncbi:MAG: hypothetical protein ACYTGF_12810, partial [Planctomycetota bacterium]
MASRRRFATVLTATLTAAGVSAAAHAGPVVYVDDDAPAGGDGQSWFTAYRFLQDGLAWASNPENNVVLVSVAGGTYTPDRDEANPSGTGDRAASFYLIEGVAIVGGYAGLGNPGDPDARDLVLYETVLSGDLAGDDQPDFQGVLENAYHVMSTTALTNAAKLEGVTITAGNADGPTEEDQKGAGMYNAASNPLIEDCIFRYNRTALEYAALGGDGGGMHNTGGSSPTVLACDFLGNEARTGGGMYNEISSVPVITDCTFVT